MMRTEFNDISILIEKVSRDSRLTTVDFGLFSAMLICWKKNGFENPFSISRSRLMLISKICSTKTYHKCLRSLQECGYIIYRPSYHPTLGSKVFLGSIGFQD
ncbi:hypothetical protein DRW42_07175 [Pedobacter miscanthi]|uniref:Transcriptional regulator n=1 Tax=Pedobacter miscanthi TaxID=2259170 RepID=A0A366L691_9SPHI|nr:hypothetical protein DRW42_07175 [Pedobacter miscanthi]